MNIYRPGTIVRANAYFYQDGQPFDPSRVTFTLAINNPETEETATQTWEFGRDPELERESCGHYVAAVSTPVVGVYSWAWLTSPPCEPNDYQFAVTESDE